MCTQMRQICLTSNIVNMTFEGVEKRDAKIWFIVIWSFGHGKNDIGGIIQ